MTAVQIHPVTADHRLPHDERSRQTAELLEQASQALTAEERTALLDQVIVLNVRVARAVAARYRGRGVPLEDLEQVACMGLTKAVQRFDAGHHRDLLSYAVPTIRGEVLRFFRDKAWTMRPPRRVQELQWQVNQAAAELAAELGREPTDEETRSRLGITRAAYDEAVQAFGCFRPASLDRPLDGSDQLTLGESLRLDDDQTTLVDDRVWLGQAIERLAPGDRRLLQLRFVEECTQSEIARLTGMPQAQVSRRLSRLMRELRGTLGTTDRAS